MSRRGPAASRVAIAAGALALAAIAGCATNEGDQTVGAAATSAPAAPDPSGPSSTEAPSTEPATTAPPTSGSVARPAWVPDAVHYQREADETTIPETSTYTIRYDGEGPTYLEVFTYHGDQSWVVEDAHAVPTKVGDHDALFAANDPENPDQGLRILSWYPLPDMYVQVVSSGPISEEALHRVAESIVFEEAS